MSLIPVLFAMAVGDSASGGTGQSGDVRVCLRGSKVSRERRALGASELLGVLVRHPALIRGGCKVQRPGERAFPPSSQAAPREVRPPLHHRCHRRLVSIVRPLGRASISWGGFRGRNWGDWGIGDEAVSLKPSPQSSPSHSSAALMAFSPQIDPPDRFALWKRSPTARCRVAAGTGSPVRPTWSGSCATSTARPWDRGRFRRR